MIVPSTAGSEHGHALDPVIAALAAQHPSSSEALANAWAGVRHYISDPGTRPELRSVPGSALLLARAMAVCGERELARELTARIPGFHPLMSGLQDGRLLLDDIRYLSAGIIRPVARSEISPGISLLVDGGTLRDNREFTLDFAVLPVFRQLAGSALRIFALCSDAGMLLLRGWRMDGNAARNEALDDILHAALARQPGIRPHIVWTD